jgi:hypothetical protein
MVLRFVGRDLLSNVFGVEGYGFSLISEGSSLCSCYADRLCAALQGKLNFVGTIFKALDRDDVDL